MPQYRCTPLGTPDFGIANVPGERGRPLRPRTMNCVTPEADPAARSRAGGACCVAAQLTRDGRPCTRSRRPTLRTRHSRHATKQLRTIENPPVTTRRPRLQHPRSWHLQRGRPEPDSVLWPDHVGRPGDGNLSRYNGTAPLPSSTPTSTSQWRVLRQSVSIRPISVTKAVKAHGRARHGRVDGPCVDALGDNTTHGVVLRAARKQSPRPPTSATRDKLRIATVT